MTVVNEDHHCRRQWQWLVPSAPSHRHLCWWWPSLTKNTNTAVNDNDWHRQLHPTVASVDDDCCQQRLACKQTLGWRHYPRARPPSSPLCRQGTCSPLPMCCEVCQPAIQLRSPLYNNKYMGEEMREYFSRTWFNTMPELEQSTQGIFSFHPNSTTLYLMISCKGKLRNGKKHAKLAYLLLISGNSGIQQHMA